MFSSPGSRQGEVDEISLSRRRLSRLLTLAPIMMCPLGATHGSNTLNDPRHFLAELSKELSGAAAIGDEYLQLCAGDARWDLLWHGLFGGADEGWEPRVSTLGERIAEDFRS